MIGNMDHWARGIPTSNEANATVTGLDFWRGGMPFPGVIPREIPRLVFGENIGMLSTTVNRAWGDLEGELTMQSATPLRTMRED